MTGETDVESVVHPLAVVEDGAQLGRGVTIGPFCHVSGQARLCDGVSLVGHVSVLGDTTIGEGTTVWPQTTLGAPPQAIKHKGGPVSVTIGRECTIRENVTIHAGTDFDRHTTVVGDRCYFMAYSHVAHDCVVGDDVLLSNGATLGGHCVVGDHVIVGGLTAVHQFSRVGHHAFLGGCSAIVGDVIPFGAASGNRATLRGFNLIGMKRSGMPRAQIAAMRSAYRILFHGEGSMEERAERVRGEFADIPVVLEIAEFLTERAKRHYCLPGKGDADDGGGDGKA